MKSKRELIVNVNLDWRVLAIVGIIGLILAFSYSLAGAQGGEPPKINEVRVEPTEDPSAPPPVTVPELPAAQAGDVSFTINGEWVPRDSIGRVPLSPIGAADIRIQAASGRSFYQTQAVYATNQVLTACAAGYHTASLWEMLDVSNLSYAYNHPAAHVQDDSGKGPPSGWYGWVRTGNWISTSGTAGTGNCNNWSSTSGSHSGVAVRLSTAWETAPGDISAWDATAFTCNFSGEVWCVQDSAGGVYLPILLKNY